MLPEQKHPEHSHKQKTETFHFLYGITLVNKYQYKQGEMLTINPYDSHCFEDLGIGCVFEEISTTHIDGDSYYSDDNVLENRKTKLTWRNEWLTEGVK